MRFLFALSFQGENPGSRNLILSIRLFHAYKRRNITLDEISHSSESSVSHFSINEEVDENGERKIELRDDNPFLHDNVD